ncbi:MAG: acyl-CoA dehydrogenase family protein [Dehalococcoidia bacterium]
MDFAFSEEQALLRRVLGDFAAAELAPRYAEWDRSGEFPRALWRRMGELGVTGARVPEAYGGSALDAVSTGIAAEEIARGDFNLSYGVLMPALVAEVLRQHAGERVREQWLRPLASGEAVLGLALSEPGAGSDARAITTRAVRDGDEYVLNGEKSGISLLMAADACVTFAKTDPEAGSRGVTAFLVPMAASGVTRIAFRDMGSRAVGRGALHLDGVRVPADYRVGEEGSGFRSVMNGFDFSRFLIGLMCLGAAAASLAETMTYVKGREAFGQPLARFEGVQFPIAEHATYIEAARWLCYRGLWLRDTEQPHTKEAAMAKWWAPKVAVDCIHDCLLLHGQYGYTQDLPHEQRLRDVIGLQIGDGTAQIQKIIIARELMGREYLPY